MTDADPKTLLPLLRRDLEIHAGPDDVDATPTWIIHDPVSGKFEKASWAHMQVIRRLTHTITLGEMLDQLRHTTLHLTAEDILVLCTDLTRKGLTQVGCIAKESDWNELRRRKKLGWFAVVMKILYARIPLIRPDAFLEKTLPLVRWLVCPQLVTLYIICAVAGITTLALRFDQYVATFPQFFSAAGIVTYIATLIGIKFLHEFAHAYTAKALGVRVRTMGLAFLMLIPVAYSDVTDSWRMRSRLRRVAIALAGILAELTLAAIALCVWAASPPGLVHSVAFVVSSATLIATLLANLNPLMRFDGYYALCDLVGIDNLMQRSFALATWTVRRTLFALDVPCSEPTWSHKTRTLMLIYAFSAWVYRLFLYTGIALILYHNVTKVIGAILFAAAIASFLIRPIVREIHEVIKMKSRITSHRRLAVTCTAFALLILWLVAPLPRSASLSAITLPRDSQLIYAPNDGVITRCDLALGQRVTRGQTLLVLQSDELNTQKKLAELDHQRVRTELAILRDDIEQRGMLTPKNDELARVRAEQAGIQQALHSNRVVAAIDGVVTDIDDLVTPGQSIGRRTIVARIVATDHPKLLAYLPQSLVNSVKTGQRVRFTPESSTSAITGHIVQIDATEAAILTHPALAVQAGGELATSIDEAGRIMLADTWYCVHIDLDNPPADLRLGQRGKLRLWTAPRSHLADLVRWATRVVIRESGS